MIHSIVVNITTAINVRLTRTIEKIVLIVTKHYHPGAGFTLIAIIDQWVGYLAPVH